MRLLSHHSPILTSRAQQQEIINERRHRTVFEPSQQERTYPRHGADYPDHQLPQSALQYFHQQAAPSRSQGFPPIRLIPPIYNHKPPPIISNNIPHLFHHIGILCIHLLLDSLYPYSRPHILIHIETPVVIIIHFIIIHTLLIPNFYNLWPMTRSIVYDGRQRRRRCIPTRDGGGDEKPQLPYIIPS